MVKQILTGKELKIMEKAITAKTHRMEGKIDNTEKKL